MGEVAPVTAGGHLIDLAASRWREEVRPPQLAGLLRLKQSTHITKAILLELEANGFQIVKKGGISQ
ncbi:MAG TPA: hypothetical protein VEN78_27965 [Bradyrhizobium sp.]|nr:hypothetical protein [Bradyrhizobium sp.]